MRSLKAIATTTILFACILEGRGADTLSDGLVAYYPFNGNTNDESGNGWDGVGSPIPTEDRFGEPDNAYFFSDLTHHILIPSSEGLHLDSALSISLWFATTHTGPEQNVMLAKHAGGYRNGYFMLMEPGGELGVSVGDTNHLTAKTIDPGLCDGSWHHAVGTYDGTMAQLYVDGVLRDSRTENRAPVNDDPLVIGTHAHVLTGEFWDTTSVCHGALDDIRIYDRVLTEDEVLELYSAPGPALAFQRGDSDATGALNITDAVFTLSYLFLSGPATSCLDAADADDNGSIQITDAIFTLSYLFLGGPQLPTPTGSCGADPTEDDLGCGSFPQC
jgi:hypothetical protein